MPQRARKLVGTIVLVVFISFYALTAMTVAAAKLPGSSWLVQLAYFATAGLLWIVPVAPLIKWMQKPDQPKV
jgi:membrane protein implicated in regulation of membrane protease activity